METDGNGTFYLQSKEFESGSLYMYLMKYKDGSVSKLLPDPRSRFQPEDVHGPSQVVPVEFPWSDGGFQSPTDVRKLVPTRIHIGTFTPEGTLKAAIKKLDYIKDMGYNAVEVMPIMEFPGKRNWGYDMVGWFAVENAYGRPEDFKQFVDEAHKRGMAVYLDMVYNHIGPEGNYFSKFDRSFLSYGSTPWGDGFNFNNPKAVEFVKDNANTWVKEFHVDGFRFDMTKYIPDHVTRDVTNSLYMTKQALINMAEDARNQNYVTMPHDWETSDQSGYKHKGLGFHGQWNFDFHHAVQSVITGHSHMGAPTTVGGLADVLERGFRWPDNNWMRELEQGVNFTQSHDEIGNWDGARLHGKVPANKAKVASMLKYVVPGIPLNFMGEEYGEKQPFYFFVDHSDPVLIKAMEQDQKKKNSPQPPWTQPQNFEQSKLSWNPSNGIAELNKDMIALRKSIPALWEGGRPQMKVDRSKLASNVLFIHRRGKEHPNDEVVIAINLSGYDFTPQSGGYKAPLPKGKWVESLNTNDTKYGGTGLTNCLRTFERKDNDGEPVITLPGWSLSIFHKVP